METAEIKAMRIAAKEIRKSVEALRSPVRKPTAEDYDAARIMAKVAYDLEHDAGLLEKCEIARARLMGDLK